MKTSENIEEIAKSLCKAQSEFRSADKSGYNTYFKSRYSTFDDIVTAVRPSLGKNGLSFVVNVGGQSPSVEIYVILIHESGQWIRSESISYDVSGESKGNPTIQDYGKCITYLKRYALASFLGIESDEDIDGNSPDMQKKPTKTPNAKTAQDNNQPVLGENKKSHKTKPRRKADTSAQLQQGPTEAEKQKYWNSLGSSGRAAYKSKLGIVDNLVFVDELFDTRDRCFDWLESTEFGNISDKEEFYAARARVEFYKKCFEMLTQPKTNTPKEPPKHIRQYKSLIPALQTTAANYNGGDIDISTWVAVKLKIDTWLNHSQTKGIEGVNSIMTGLFDKPVYKDSDLTEGEKYAIINWLGDAEVDSIPYKEYHNLLVAMENGDLI